jgi:serine/threonine-protein kinase
LAAAAVAGGAAVAGAFAWWSAGETTPREPPIAAAPAAAVVDEASPHGQPEIEAGTDRDGAGEEHVVVRVRSSPEGARVLVAGEPRGTTPLDLELPRSSDVIVVRLARDGYRSETQRIVPDADQEFHLALERMRSRGRARRRAPMEHTEPAPMEPTSEEGMTDERENRFERFD